MGKDAALTALGFPPRPDLADEDGHTEPEVSLGANPLTNLLRNVLEAALRNEAQETEEVCDLQNNSTGGHLGDGSCRFTVTKF